jgi:hypothetical protein
MAATLGSHVSVLLIIDQAQARQECLHHESIQSGREYTHTQGATDDHRTFDIYDCDSRFLIGFGLGGLSLHIASAKGLFGLKDSVTPIGSSLLEMQKNVDELQKNMNVLKQTKDKLSSPSLLLWRLSSSHLQRENLI